MALHSAWSGVVGGKGEIWPSKSVQHFQQVPCRPIDILGRIVRIDPEIARRLRHQLSKPDGTGGTDRRLPIRRLDLYVRLKQRQPIATGEPGPPKRRVTGVAHCGRLDQGGNIGAR